MTALAKNRQHATRTISALRLLLESGSKSYRNGMAALRIGTGKTKPAQPDADLMIIGTYEQEVDATGGDKFVVVNLGREILCQIWENGSSITSAHVGRLCYALDDQTVTLTPGEGGAPIAGRIWGVDASLGVIVEPLPDIPAGSTIIGTLPGQVGNDFILPLANLIPGATYLVGTTAAASTVTLPANAPEGIRIKLLGDGSANGHTVQYRDVTGPTVLTTALAASKRHVVEATFLAGKWFATAYVSP